MTDPKSPAAPTGPQEGRCGAVKGRDDAGNPIRWCRKFPRRGGIRCEDDGGNSPQALAAAERRQAEQAAAAAVVTYGLPVEVHPVEALRGELARTQGAVLWLEQQVRNLAPGDLLWGLTELKDVGSGERPGQDRTEAAVVHGWMEHYRWERKHLESVSATCIKVGIDLLEQARIRQTAEDFLSVLRTVVSALGHDGDDPRVTDLIYRALSLGSPLAVKA